MPCLIDYKAAWCGEGADDSGAIMPLRGSQDQDLPLRLATPCLPGSRLVQVHFVSGQPIMCLWMLGLSVPSWP